MPLSRDSKKERIWKLIKRTEFRLKQGIERITWEEEVLFPQIEAMKAGKPVAGLPANAELDIVIIEPTDEIHHPRETDDTAERADAAAIRGEDFEPPSAGA